MSRTVWFPKPVEFIKKAKKEDLPNTESTLKVQNASEVENSTPAEVFSKSSELEKKKSNSYEYKRVRKFQWNWLSMFPWLRINMQYLFSIEGYDITYPYPQMQLSICEVYSMYCAVCSKQSQSLSGTDIAKKSGTKVFKVESLKKHEKSQVHSSCVEAFNIRQNPQETPVLNSLNKAIGVNDAKLEKRF